MQNSTSEFYQFELGGLSAILYHVTSIKNVLLRVIVSSKCSISEELISILLFFFKAPLVVLPYTWTLGIAAFCINLLVRLVAEDYVLSANLMISMVAICTFGLLPLVLYLLYLVVNFGFDIAKAIFSMSEHMEKIVPDKTVKND